MQRSRVKTHEKEPMEDRKQWDSIFKVPKEKLSGGMVAYLCNPSIWEPEEGRSWEFKTSLGYKVICF